MGEGLGDLTGERGEREVVGFRDDMSDVNSGRVLDLGGAIEDLVMIFIGVLMIFMI